MIGAQFSAANYQVLGATPEDDLVLETLGIQGLKSVALGAAFMHDSRDNEDMPSRGWYFNLNNLAYREALGGANSYDAYRVDIKVFVPHGAGLPTVQLADERRTRRRPGTVVLRGYKLGEYLAPYLSSLEVEERISFGRRWGATLFAGLAALYGTGVTPLEREAYPMGGAGLQFILKPDKASACQPRIRPGHPGQSRDFLKLGYAW